MALGLRAMGSRNWLQRPEEVEDRHRGDAGRRHRQHDLEENPERAAAIERRRLGDFLGQRLEERVEEKHREGQGKGDVGDDQARQRIKNA